jgi:hypothetical protein
VIGGGQDGQCGRGHGADQGLPAGEWTGSATSCTGAWAGDPMSCSSWPTPCRAEGPVHSLVGLCLRPEHRRGHGASTTRSTAAGRTPGGCARRRFGSAYHGCWGGRAGGSRSPSTSRRGRARTRRPVPSGCSATSMGVGGRSSSGFPAGPISWAVVLDAVRLGRPTTPTVVTAAQLRAARHWQPGDPAILVVFDSGYDVHRLAFVLADLPIQLIGRIRADRVLLAPAPPRPVHGPVPLSRPRRHGAVWSGPIRAAGPTLTTAATTTARAAGPGWGAGSPRCRRRGRTGAAG